MKPYGSNVLLERQKSSRRFAAGLIYIPDEILQHDSFECKVLEVGPGEIMSNGEREPMNLIPGEYVLVFQGMGTEVGSQTFIVDVSGIDAVIERI